MNRTNRPRLSRISGSSYASKLLGRAGDGSTLTLDFTTGVLDPRLTFSRDGGGTYIGNDGRVYGMDFATSSSLAIGTGSKSVTLTATANVDRRYLIRQTVWISNGANNMRGPVTAYDASTQVLTINAANTTGSGSFTSWTVGNASARFDYDPTTLAPKGLLIEGSANNLLKYSSYADTFWIAYGGYTKAYTTGITSPAGDTSAVRVTFDAVGKGLYTNNTQMGYTNSVGATYTFSAWIRATSSTTNAKIRFGDSAVALGPDIPISTTWTRYSYQYNAVANSGPAIQSASGTATGEFEMWGMQLETGSASSYIPTGASQGNRAADNCELLDLTTMGFNANTGTIYTDVGTRLNTGSQRNYTFLPASGGTNQIFEGSGVAFNVFSSGSFVAQIGTSGYIAAKIAAAYATGDYAVSVNGGAVATDSAGAVPISLTKLTIGGSVVNAAAYANGCIRVFKYWPTRLPNAQLQSLTT